MMLPLPSTVWLRVQDLHTYVHTHMYVCIYSDMTIVFGPARGIIPDLSDKYVEV